MVHFDPINMLSNTAARGSSARASNLGQEEGSNKTLDTHTRHTHYTHTHLLYDYQNSFYFNGIFCVFGLFLKMWVFIKSHFSVFKNYQELTQSSF